MNEPHKLPATSHLPATLLRQRRSSNSNYGSSIPAANTFVCRLCGAPTAARAWLGAECEQCGSVSVIDLPSPTQLSIYYRTYGDSYTGGGDSGGTNLLRYARRYKQLVHIYGPLQSGLRLLDVGSSTSPFPNLMAAADLHISVLDYVCPPQLHAAITFIPGHLGDTPQLENETGVFDVVTCWAVLEHVADPKSAIKQLCQLCAKGGVVLVSTPEIGTTLTNYSIGHSAWFFPPEHLHLISPRALRGLFAERGFDVVGAGRIEVSTARFWVRYAVGVAEMLLGGAVRWALPATWQRWRDTRTHRFKGISWFAFARPAPVPNPVRSTGGTA